MKTAISIPDDVFKRAEALAKRLGVSRSGLYTRAIAEYLEARREEGVTEALNQIYGEESSALDLALAAMQALSLREEEW